MGLIRSKFIATILFAIHTIRPVSYRGPVAMNRGADHLLTVFF